MAAGWGVGNPAVCECAPRSGDWPHVAMVAGFAFTGIRCSFCGGGTAGGRGGVLIVHIVHVCTGSCLQVSRFCGRRMCAKKCPS